MEMNHKRKILSKERNIDEGKELRKQLEALEHRHSKITEEMNIESLKLPNSFHPDVPLNEERVIRVIGKPPVFSFEFRDHLKLGAELDLIDFSTAAITSGEKFYYLKNEATLMELALVNWSMQKLVGKGYTPVITPDLVRHEIADGCGYQPKGPASQTFSIENHNLCLTGTAEVPLVGMYANRILPISDLPIKMVGLSHCFRVEVGRRGVEVKGLYRVV